MSKFNFIVLTVQLNRPGLLITDSSLINHRILIILHFIGDLVFVCFAKMYLLRCIAVKT